MMTSKEALEKICSKCEEARAKQRIRCPFRSISNEYCEEYETIEKELKALGIIKSHRVNVDAFLWFCETAKPEKILEVYNAYNEKDKMYEQMKLWEIEVDILKEVLFNEK